MINHEYIWYDQWGSSSCLITLRTFCWQNYVSQYGDFFCKLHNIVSCSSVSQDVGSCCYFPSIFPAFLHADSCVEGCKPLQVHIEVGRRTDRKIPAGFLYLIIVHDAFFQVRGPHNLSVFSDYLLSFCGRSLLLAMIDEETSRSPKHPKAHCTTTKVFEVWSYLFFEIIPLGFTECSSLSHLPGATIRLKSLSLDSSVVLDRDGPFCAATVAKGVEKQMTNIHIYI